MTQKDIAKELGISQSYLCTLLKTNSLEVLKERHAKGLSLLSGNNKRTRHENKVKANILSYPPRINTQLPSIVGDITIVSKVYLCFNNKTHEVTYMTQEEVNALGSIATDNIKQNHG